MKECPVQSFVNRCKGQAVGATCLVFFCLLFIGKRDNYDFENVFEISSHLVHIVGLFRLSREGCGEIKHVWERAWPSFVLSLTLDSKGKTCHAYSERHLDRFLLLLK